MEEKDTEEKLFRIGGKNFTTNSLYALIGPSNTRQMVVAYDLETDRSTWVEPTGKTFYADGRGLLAIIYENKDFEDAFDTPKHFLRYNGGGIDFDRNYKPTQEQITLLVNWYLELERAGINGMGFETLPLKDSSTKQGQNH